MVVPVVQALLLIQWSLLLHLDPECLKHNVNPFWKHQVFASHLFSCSSKNDFKRQPFLNCHIKNLNTDLLLFLEAQPSLSFQCLQQGPTLTAE